MSTKSILHIRRDTTVPGETRVAFTASHVAEILKRYNNIQFQVESGAGDKSDSSDNDYRQAGATIVDPKDAVNAAVSFAVKGTGPGQFYGKCDYRFHHGANANVTGGCEAVDSGAWLVTADQDILMPELARPVLNAMSQYTGVLSPRWMKEFRPQKFLKAERVVIIGGGQLGRAAYDEFLACGINPDIIRVGDNNPEVLKTYPDGTGFQSDNSEELKRAMKGVYLLVGGVLIPGKPTPLIIPNQLWSSCAAPGALCLDAANDQGGCTGGAQSRVKNQNLTTHENRWASWTQGKYICVVQNMPAAGGVEASNLFADALVPMLPHLFNTNSDWSPRIEAVTPALIARNGEVTDDAFAKRLERPFVPIAA